MQDDFDRAQYLAKLGAPLEAQAMALLLGWSRARQTREKEVRNFLEVSKWAASDAGSYPMLPEIKQWLELENMLPPALRVCGDSGDTPVAKTDPGKPLVPRTVEAITSWMTSPLPFAKALEIADFPRRWGEATPQITKLHFDDLCSEGSLWRGRLTKCTDLGKPLVTGLKTEETIEITAEGSDAPDGSGHRRYSYVFVSAVHGPDMLTLVEDTGWIELSGDASGTQLRLQKRAAVLRPVKDDYAAILSAAFVAELWLWATGFFEAAGAQPPILKCPEPPKWEKKISPQSNEASVAVLGGGPAGLACAWLLSNPILQSGKPAWTSGSGLKVKVALVEKDCRLGGKAASGRRTDNEKYRIEEHGLHVAMGFYANLPAILESVGAADTLQDLSNMRVPYEKAGNPARPWELPFEPWKKCDCRNPATLKEWLVLNTKRESSFSEKAKKEAAAFELSTNRPRPLLRTFTLIARQISLLEAPPFIPIVTWQLVAMMLNWLLSRLFWAELTLGYRLEMLDDPIHPETEKSFVSSPPLESDVAPMARLFRWFARFALPADDENPKIRLASEVVELATTIAIGLDEVQLFPRWAVDDPRNLPGELYGCWIRALQLQDARSIDAWLIRYGVAEGFSGRSRILAAVTAGLFTTPDQIAAGTFINGLARLVLTYELAPYQRMLGGTGEAIIGPIYESLRDSSVEILLGTEVTGVTIESKCLKFVTLLQTKNCKTDANFGIWPADATDRRRGWRVDLQYDKVNEMHIRPFDACVLAIPPFQGSVPGLPADLAEKLEDIHSRATIGLQNWTNGDPRFEHAIISALKGTLPCTASMDHLKEGADNGGSESADTYRHPPIYACGDVDDDVARQWGKSNVELDKWLEQNQSMLQDGIRAHAPFLIVNDKESARYVCADVETQKARLYVYETDVENLWLAGDWTRSALSCGSIEAAITSGLEAARDVLQALGCKVDFPIVGAIFERQP